MGNRNLKNIFVIFSLIAACLCFYFVLDRWSALCVIFAKISQILTPVFAGLILAYVINPIMIGFRRILNFLLGKVVHNAETLRKAVKALSIILTYLFVVGILTIFFSIVIPEVYRTVIGLTEVVPQQLERLNHWLNDTVSTDNETLSNVKSALQSAYSYIETYLADFISRVQESEPSSMLDYVRTGLMGLFNVVYNLLIGIVVSIYALAHREACIGHGKKLTYAIFPAKAADVVIKAARRVNRIFSGFISGKIIDSLIIGIIAYICLNCLNMPYPLLNSVIIGCTNVIPIFGPFVGAVPCVALVFLVDPFYALKMILFILILQQVDGNIIGPYILGDSTGLPGFWVLISLIFFGGMWGFAGMIVGVPLCACIYYLIKALIEMGLRYRNFPTDTEEYVDVAYYENGALIHTKEMDVDEHKAYMEKQKGTSQSILRGLQKIWEKLMNGTGGVSETEGKKSSAEKTDSTKEEI